MNSLLYILWNPSLTIGPIRWYSLCWLIGLALAYLVVKRLYKEQHIKDELFDPLFIYCFVGILIGARLGHCIFYQPDYFLTSWKGFVEMLLPIHFLHDGGWKFTGYEGLASHGGTLGLMMALWLYVRKTKLSIWQVLDNIAIATGTTACFIRLGNLMNSEIIGKVTDVPWAFIFERVDQMPRHPGQLYEAIAYGILFGIMWTIYKKNANSQKPIANSLQVGTGWYFGFCLTYIFTFRFFIEYTKEIQEAFEASLPIDMGQILSIPFIIIGVACMAGGRWMKRLTMLAVLVVLSPVAQAQDNESQRYYELYAQDDAKAFYEASAKAKAKQLEEHNRHHYYVLCINEVSYEVKQNNNGKALKLASQILEEMKEHKDGRYDLIYTALGSIYENRGNYTMARHYNQKALDCLQTGDSIGSVGAYMAIANLEASVHPDEALVYVNKLKPICYKRFPNHYNYVLTLEALAEFFKNDSEAFFETLDQYNVYNRENNVKEEQNDKVMATLKKAFDGNYQDVLKEINQDQFYSENIGRFDMRIQLYRMMGDKDMVIKELENKLNAIDSLNSNLIYENMNEMNAALEVNKTEEQAARVRIYGLAAIILLLAVVIGLLLWRYLTRRRLQQRLLQQNKELEIALKHAEEADRMKISFIEHVSHEIRTPLNIITGFTQVITNPDYEVEKDDRDRMLQDISRNTTEIINIINELLELADDESKEYYEKSDTVAVNTICKQLLKRMEKQNIQHLDVDFITDLTDDFTIHTNELAMKKALGQLLDNAIKFTEEGRVELYVHSTPDNGMVRFIVTDTGIGIAKENHERIFDRFFKVDSFKQGFGLGLTMSRKIAILLGGSLYLDADYDKGSRFIFSLPTA